MTTVAEKEGGAAELDEGAGWSRVTHRAGLILQASVPAADLPPYDPEPEWTKALNWSHGEGDEGEVDDGLFDNLALENAPPFPTTDSKKLMLGVIRAKAAAQIVMRDHARYNKLVSDVIGAENGLTLDFRDEKPTVRFDPGLIVDLPSFTIKRAAAEIASGRICLTVCMNESRFKIWTRISSSKDSEWGANPCERVDNLVTKSRVWFERYADAVRLLYEKNISEALWSSGEQRESAVSLTVRNKIEFISGDTELPGLGRLTAAIANGIDPARDPLATAAAKWLDAMIRCTPGMGLVDDGRDAVAEILRPTSSTLGSGRYYFVPHLTSRGFRGVYAVRAQDENLIFAGIASTDSEPLVTVHRLGGRDRQVLSSPSQHVTAELANTVAKYF